MCVCVCVCVNYQSGMRTSYGSGFVSAKTREECQHSVVGNAIDHSDRKRTSAQKIDTFNCLPAMLLSEIQISMPQNSWLFKNIQLLREAM